MTCYMFQSVSCVAVGGKEGWMEGRRRESQPAGGLQGRDGGRIGAGQQAEP